MQHTVKKNRATRIAYRMVGAFFVAIGAAFILLMIKTHAVPADGYSSWHLDLHLRHMD